MRIRSTFINFKRFNSGSNSTDHLMVLSRDLYKKFMERCEPNVGLETVKQTSGTFHNSIDRTEIKYGIAPDFFEYRTFLKDIETRTAPIQRFLGPNFQLSSSELLQILCGLTELPPNITEYQRLEPPAPPSPTNKVSQVYSSDQLRALGRRIYDLQVRLVTTFNGNHLSMSPVDIQSSFVHFTRPNNTIIPFMKKNQIYECIIPFTGTNREKELKEAAQIEARKLEIKDTTAIASFYTMLGMLCMKFGTGRVIDEIIIEKILIGNNGIIRTLSESLSKSNKFSI